MTRRGLFLFVALSIIWGLPYFFIKIAVVEVSHSFLVFIRTALAAVIMLAIAARRKTLRQVYKYWPWVTLFAVFEMIGPWWLIADAERTLDSGLTGLLLATVPLFGTIIARLRGDISVTSPSRLFGLAVGLFGVFLLVGADHPTGAITTFAVIQIILASIGYAIGPVIINTKLRTVSTSGVIAVSLFITAVFYAVPGLINRPQEMPSLNAILAILALTLICTVLAFVIFFALIEEIGPVKVTLITYFNPVVALLLGVWILTEPLTWGMLVGFPLILLGSYLAARPEGTPTIVE
ncbi:MAG: DMT family transporter [Candidatus Nanopelagicales bacterium]